jgi:hypothetical protein
MKNFSAVLQDFLLIKTIILKTLQASGYEVSAREVEISEGISERTWIVALKFEVLRK